MSDFIISPRPVFIRPVKSTTTTITAPEPVTLVGKAERRMQEYNVLSEKVEQAHELKQAKRIAELVPQLDLARRRITWAKKRVTETQTKLERCTDPAKRNKLAIKLHGKPVFSAGALAWVIDGSTLVPCKVTSVHKHSIEVLITADRPGYAKGKLSTSHDQVAPRAVVTGERSKSPKIGAYMWIAG